MEPREEENEATWSGRLDGSEQELPAAKVFSSAPIMIAAFSGWNDAGTAATSAVRHIADVFSAELIAEVDPDDYVDFQVNRPQLQFDEDGNRHIVWPSTQLFMAYSWAHHRRIIFVLGVEPSLQWKSYASEVLLLGQELGVKSLVSVGALLAESPHSRPLEVEMTSETPALQQEYGIPASSYEGPAGINSVLSYQALQLGMDVVSVWGTVPHYVAHAPSPKAVAALVTKLEVLLGEPINRYELDEEAAVWEQGVNLLTQQDPEVAAYVQELEHQSDTAELPEASGEVIAKEFEQYLRRQEDESS